MKRKQKGRIDWMFYFGIAAMILLLIGIFSEAGSFFQRSLFLIGALMLTLTAYMNKQWMLFVLQIVISLGSMSAFLELDGALKYVILLGASLIGLVYLNLTKRYKNDLWSAISAAGLFLIAAGFATDAIAHPLYFGLFLGVGSLLVALYSFVDYSYNKNKVAAIWFVLNIVFAINPLLMVISTLTAY